MADTLEIFGVEYTNVTGIIATTPNETDLTYIRPQGTKSISANGTGIDVAEYASVDVNVSAPSPTLQSKTVSYTPTESAQTETVSSDSGYDGLSQVNVSVGAISSTYVGSGITQRSSSDLTASGATVTVPSGYYSAQASKAVTSGIAGTPTATKGTVSNHQVSVTPSVTNTGGYISGGTINGTAVTVSASELVSGTYTVDSSGTKDVTNYASASVPTGTAGTPSASKGAVSNHSVSVTPSVTNTTGWITGSTKTGTAVTVSASELVSGSETKTENGTYDVTNLAELVVNVSGGGGTVTVGTKTATLSSTASSISFTGLSGNPTSFVVTSSADIATNTNGVTGVVYDGTSLHGQTMTTQVTADTGFAKSYSGGTLTITATTASFQANEYKLVYTYGGSSSDIHTADVQVGSGATSITFSSLSGRPVYWSCIFKSDFSTSSGYQRVIEVVNDGSSIYGMAMDSEANAQTSWTATYSGGNLTISSSGTNNGGYFHQTGYYQLTYAYDDAGGSTNIGTKTATGTSSYTSSLQFTSLSGTPKAFFVRLTTQISRSSSNRYYYVENMRWDGSSSGGVAGRCFYQYSGQLTNITSEYSYSYSSGTLTITSSATSRSASPGAFYNGTYELVYIY